MADRLKYLEREILNKVLNAGEDALKVDIDNVTLKTEGSDINIEVQIRYRSIPVKAKLQPIVKGLKDLRDDSYLIKFREEQFSIAPGQAAVFYSGEVLLGGGVIEVD